MNQAAAPHSRIGAFIIIAIMIGAALALALSAQTDLPDGQISLRDFWAPIAGPQSPKIPCAET
jgi:hypothetical protein